MVGINVSFHCKGRNDDLQLGLLKSDLEYTKWKIMKGLNDNIKRIKHDKNVAFRLTRLLMRLGKKMGIEQFINIIETASESYSVYDFKVEKTVDGIVLEMEIKDFYFDLVENLPLVGLIGKVFQSRKHFMNEVEESLKNEYGYVIIKTIHG